MHLKWLLARVLALAVAVAAAPTKQGFDWEKSEVRGVNIGGWLVLEPFITPWLFDKYSTPSNIVRDEYGLCAAVGKHKCWAALKPHWDSFATLSDFWKIANAGFNLVRIPIGYWAFVDLGEPYTSGAADYLDAAIDWARQTGLKVMIDLHGAPGSQNGFDHSGRKLDSPGWGQGDTVQQTLDVLKIIGDKFATREMQDVVVAIQFLNEPFLPQLEKEMVKQFYRDAFFTLRETSNTTVVLHDGFMGSSWMDEFLTPDDNGARFVVVDFHYYQVFDAYLNSVSPDKHREMACSASGSSKDKWSIVGEWSGAMTDCAPHLNGYGAGNRYEGKLWGSWWVGSCKGKSGKVKDWSEDWKKDVKRYIEAQMRTFEQQGKGWVFWNFKTQGGAGEWDLFQLLDGGVWPEMGKGTKVCG
ncbi:glycoside hydrolase family 5 protein [Sporormia fimetaria CBS 119925]|uniref:Glycoside hydrolase family 5 protein n=1 Tax=Sporormia fimetaria CBS 119925 TaxID=1340428 RepID=A0A6A6V4R1_9PLEO|nr:glycoside hydrolase family 5 protein [Sporormia fimetaria CBS 119925]